MPNLLSVQDSIRASGYDFSGFLNVPPREVVLEGTVTAAAAEPMFAISYTGTGGDYTDVEPHMEVEVFSSAGASKGRLRVALGTVTSTSLPVNETSKGRMKVVAGDTFVVMREWRLRDLLVGASLTFPKDSRVAYTNQNALVAPLPLTGGHWAGPADDGQAYATVPFFGSLSRVMDADSGGTKTYLWDVKDGTIVTGTSTDADIVVQFPAGKRWIDFTVTDADNSASATQRVCVIVEDAEHPPLPCSIDDLSGTRADGWRVTFQLPLSAYSAISALPDGQMILYHEDEWRAGTKASYGSPIDGRSRLKFVGFLVRESINVDQESGFVTFEALSPLAVLSLLPGFSQALLDQASSTWQTYPDLTVLNAIVYLIVWHTTLPMLFDLDMSKALDRPYPRLYIQQNTPYAEVMELVDNLSSEFVCDRAGRFYVQRKFSCSTTEVRDAADTLLRLTASDIVSLRVTREHRYKSAQMEGKGFTQGASGKPVLSVAPGEAPAEAPDFTSSNTMIVTDQEELNVLTGWAYAEENSLYNGMPVPPELEIRLRGGYDVGDFTAQVVLLDLPPEYDPRGIGYDDARLQIESIQITYGDGGKEVTWTCSHETIGEKGTMRHVPQDSLSNIGIDFNLDFNIPYPTVSTGSRLTPPPGAVPLKMLVQGPAAGQFSRSTMFDFAAGTANFENIGAAITGAQFDGAPDRWRYSRRFVITEDGIFECPNVWDVSPSFSLMASGNDIFGTPVLTRARIETSINRRGYIAVSSGDLFACSFNDGASWTVTNFTGYATGLGTHGVSSFVLSPRNNGGDENDGVLYLAYRIQGAAWGVPTHWRIFKSTDWGRTWNLRPNLNYSANFGQYEAYMHIPYTKPGGAPNANDDSQWLWWHYSEGDAGPMTSSWMSTNGGSSVAYSRGYPTFGSPTPRVYVRQQTSYTDDGAYGYLMFADNSYTYIASTKDGWVSFFTGDHGSTATNQFIPMPLTWSSFPFGCNGWGTSPDIMLWWGGNGLHWTVDRGLNWVNLSAPHSALIAEFDLTDWIENAS